MNNEMTTMGMLTLGNTTCLNVSAGSTYIKTQFSINNKVHLSARMLIESQKARWWPLQCNLLTSNMPCKLNDFSRLIMRMSWDRDEMFKTKTFSWGRCSKFLKQGKDWMKRNEKPASSMSIAYVIHHPNSVLTLTIDNNKCTKRMYM